MIDTDVEGGEHLETPFTVGRVVDDPFIHVFDEFALSVAVGEFDTALDFFEYLRDRRELLSSRTTSVVAAGEEQLAAAYVLNGDEDTRRFLPNDMAENATDIYFDESFYDQLVSHPAYKQRNAANERSRLWDRLIERFIHQGDPELAPMPVTSSNDDVEVALRYMASENRFSRRTLVDHLLETLEAAARDGSVRRARVMGTQQRPDIVYVFLVLAKGEDQSYQQYREERVAWLHAYGRCAKLRFPCGKCFVALGFDYTAAQGGGGSEDLLLLTLENWTDEAKIGVERRCEELNILQGNTPTRHTHVTEFPRVIDEKSLDSGEDGAREWERENQSKGRKRNARKVKRKMQRASRRRNRRS